MVAKRKAISKKIRFEVFKRDSFKCQYCGVSAPDTILHVDHINPVSKGGENEMINLITSCRDCNSGKSARTRDDNAIAVKQKKQLDEISERREQMKLLIEWRNSINDIEDQEVEAVVVEFSLRVTGRIINGTGKKSIKKFLKKYPLIYVLDTIKIAADQYVRFGGDGNATQESAENVLDKVGAILYVKSQSKEKQSAYILRGMARKSFYYVNDRTFFTIIDHAQRVGITESVITDTINTSDNWLWFCRNLNDLIEQAG